MVTYFLSDEDIRAYLRDFISRLERVEPFPVVWCPITKSGTKLLRWMLPLLRQHHPDFLHEISTVGIGVNSDETIKFEITSTAEISKKPVLLFDSAIHTGGTMRKSVAKAIELGASNVITYSLVIKRGSCFIPTFWGATIDDTDRIYFLLDKIPNNRLDSGPEKKDGVTRKIPPVHIERLDKEHIDAKCYIKCGVDALDRVTFGDRHFNMLAGEHQECTYVLKSRHEIVGYLSLHFSDPTCLFVSEIGVDKSCESKGYGSI
jgi:Acetyltransferase (GNAT) family